MVARVELADSLVLLELDALGELFIEDLLASFRWVRELAEAFSALDRFEAARMLLEFETALLSLLALAVFDFLALLSRFTRVAERF